MVTFKVFRFDPEKDKAHRFVTYQVPDEKGLTVLEGLYYIMENLDGSLAFRSSCRAAVCGSCAMHINGQYRLACNTQVSHLGSTIVVRPLAHLPILKDMVVDLTNFFKQYEAIKPYLINDSAMPEKEILQSPKERRKIDNLVDCILCGACYGACPVAATTEKYAGPHALMKAARFINDSRDTAKDERIKLVAHDTGLWRCHTIFNCQQVCPKNLDPSGAIAQLKMKSLWVKCKEFFSLTK
jgi:succinate dehydrogenase / fumarate reductase, iron-sulfur subunit